jgi:lipopolysaccharide/colanic/teichoic acid biosynthesis glycosyltransferase
MEMKRLFDIVAAVIGLALATPLLLLFCVLIWLQDRRTPIYTPFRIGRGEQPYRIIKLRSMVYQADNNQVDSTANSDPRITALGRFIRKYKFDELPQLFNVVKGDMSLVGPRPNVERETRLYSTQEKLLLSVRPGITDFSSIVFADLGATLEGQADPNIAYNQIVRPYKSRLGLFYIDHSCTVLDIRLLWLTVLNAIDRRAALRKISALIAELGGSSELVEVALRVKPLTPAPPPGMSEIVTTRGR